MKFLITALILTISYPAFGIEVYKTAPDFEIHVYMSKTSVIQFGGATWKSVVKLKDMRPGMKRFINAWNSSDNLLDFSLNDDKERSSYTTICQTGAEVAERYRIAYKVVGGDIFEIAKVIQDSGYIPIIKFDSFNFIFFETGGFWFPNNIEPTGDWQ